jgi:DNA-binding transcriptional regulator of glucitol operon
MKYVGIFALVIAAWVLQLVLSTFQYRRYYSRLKELRKEGARTAVGMVGSNWKTKAFGVLVVDDDDVIVRAEKLSGWTVFANLKPVEGVTGLPIQALDAEEPVAGVRKRIWRALQAAKTYLEEEETRKKDAASPETEAT